MSGLLLALLQLIGGGLANVAPTVARTLALNAKVQRLLDHFDVAERTGDELPPSVAALWQTGNRLQAIRAYREATGLGLKEAKDRLERGILPPIAILERNLDRLLLHHGLSAESPTTALPGVLEELAKGRKIYAIKAYREATGASLREAKDAVDDLERELERNSGRA